MLTNSAPDPHDPPSDWLASTRLLDLDDPKLRIQAMSLTQLADTDTQKVVAIHAFIKSLPFGCVAAFNHVSAGDVLRSGHGDCHTKGTLFVALLRCVGLPARLRFVTLSSGFLRGIISLPKLTVVHAIGEVYLNGRWVQTDSYVTDEVLEAEAEKLLVQEGQQLGYGIHRDGARQWDAFNHAHGQSAPSDPASLPLQDWGVAHDPEHFYANATDPSLRIGWLTRLKWMLAAGVVNRRTQSVRLRSIDASESVARALRLGDDSTDALMSLSPPRIRSFQTQRQGQNMMKIAVSLVLLSALAACGGGGGNAGSCNGSDEVCGRKVTQTTPAVTPPTAYVEPAVQTAANVAGQCAVPRAASVLDPATGRPYGDTQGSLTTEKLWVRGFVNDTYLWFDEVVAPDPALFTVGATAPLVEPSDNSRRTVALNTNRDAVTTYFNSLRTTQVTTSGRPKDQFHFTIPTDVYTAQSTTGVATGFGFTVALLSSTPPRRALVAYTDPDTVAARNNIGRGAEFVSVDGTSVASGSAAVLNEGLFSPVIGKNYTFEVRDQGSATTRTVVLTAAAVTSVPVQNVWTLAAPNTSVGYLQFNDHIATAEGQLLAAVNQLKAANNGAGITDLVLDMRYNGGGLLAIASELAYMVAGSGKTSGQFFEKLSFNAKNPFGLTEAQKTTPFYATTQGFSGERGQVLPQLGLSRVFVLTGAGTCSASESVMNGLAGVGVQVIQIGATTCGKPYGFLPEDNCGETYFTVQFKGVNQRGYGDYADGFIPGGTGNQFAGCVVADDFTKNLGDPTEARLASALQFRQNGSCGPAASTVAGVNTAALVLASEPVLPRSYARSNRLLVLPTAAR